MLVLFILCVVSCSFNWLLLGRCGDKDIDFGLMLLANAIITTAIVFNIYILSGMV